MLGPQILRPRPDSYWAASANPPNTAFFGPGAYILNRVAAGPVTLEMAVETANKLIRDWALKLRNVRKAAK